MANPTIILHHSNFSHFGGVETFCLNFCKQLHKYFDITFLIPNFDNPKIYDFTPYANVRKYSNKDTYICDYFILATAWGTQPQKIKAKKVVQMIHADYKQYIEGWNFKYNKHPLTTHHVAVSKRSFDAFNEVTPYIADAVIYNLHDPEIPQYKKPKNKQLTLITCSRISREKGFERMLQLTELIPVPYIWHVYGKTNTSLAHEIMPKFPPQVIFHGFKDQPYQEIAEADYLVQLSDTEGMPYALIEALQQRTPVITTNYPSAKEIITEGKNGYILEFDLSDYKKIFENQIKLTTFEPLSTALEWVKFLNNGSNN